jgi:hypothetical protein
MSERNSCGTPLGLRLHIDLGEPLCPHCAHIALAKSLAAERRHTQPPPEPAQIRDLRAVIAPRGPAMSRKAKP